MTDREKKGNQEAFHTLYDSYVDDTLQTAYAITKSNRVAADIVQETFIKVYRNIESFDLKKPFNHGFIAFKLMKAGDLLKGVTTSPGR